MQCFQAQWARSPSLRWAVRPLAASEPSGLRIGLCLSVSFVLQTLAWLTVLRSVSKVFSTWCRGHSSAVSHSPHTAGLTRRSSGRSTAGHVWLSSERPCRRCPPLTSYVRPPRRHMRERQHFAKLPCATGALAESARGCPSAGGQRAIELSHRALLRSSACVSESRMAQRFAQRLEGCHPLVALGRSAARLVSFAQHHRPNPAIELTASSGLRPPPAAAHVKR